MEKKGTRRKKEIIREHIEEERRKLNSLLSGGGKVGDAYLQSLIVDRLIEEYMDC